MTARLYLAPDAYGDPTIWRDTGHDRDEAVLTRHGGNYEGFDALAGLVRAAEHRPVMHGERHVCSCGDFDCASLVDPLADGATR